MYIIVNIFICKSENYLYYCSLSQALSSQFRSAILKEESELNNECSVVPSRTNSIVGTLGYMAPDIMLLYAGHTNNEYNDGYTRAIDFWSLGCMIYK